MSILLLALGEDQLAAADVTAIQQAMPPDFRFVQTTEEKKILSLAPAIEICAGWFRPAWLQQMPKLRWAQFWGAGVNWVLEYPDLQKRPFLLTNMSGVHAVPISEHIFGMLLYHGRFLHNAHNAQQAHTWARLKHPTEPLERPFSFSWQQLNELADKTMLILGVGAIGERTAKLAQAFDMRVIGVRRNPSKASPYVDEMIGTEQLLAVLPQADCVVSTVPATLETQQLIDAKAIASMKPTAFFINIGRGETVDEAALLEALQTRRIAGAALDVFEQEPLPADAPHWTLDNLLITSHYSGGSPRYHERAAAILLENLERFREKRPLRNVIDKAEGY